IPTEDFSPSGGTYFSIHYPLTTIHCTVIPSDERPRSRGTCFSAFFYPLSTNHYPLLYDVPLAENTSPAFLSYSRDDSAFARRLAEDLKKAGASVWLDQLDIEPGEEWDSAIEEALVQSPRMLLVLSPSSVKSRNVRNEIAFALNNQKKLSLSSIRIARFLCNCSVYCTWISERTTTRDSKSCSRRY